MPIYEYACKICDHKLDALQKMSDDPLVDCPECGKPGLRRLLSAPRFRLKGQGWYETDFKGDNQRNVLTGDSEPAHGEKDKGDKDKSGKKDESKTDKRPDSKTSSKSEDTSTG